MTEQHTHTEECWCREHVNNSGNPWCPPMEERDTYPGSVDQRLDQMRKDLKALAHAAMENDDLPAAQFCLAAIETVHKAQRELTSWGYDDAPWPDIMKMQPPLKQEDSG